MVWLYVTFLRIKSRILKKKLWYISGEVSNDPDFRITFRDVEKELSSIGIIVLNPVKYERDGKDWAWYLKRDVRKLTYCSGIIMLYGWEKSQGALLENYVARRLNLKEVFISDIREALNETK